MKLNRNNADIENLRDKKVAVRLVGRDAEIDFRKWLEENGVHFNNAKLIITNVIITEICYCVEGNIWEWCDKSWFIENRYTLYEWEIVEEENTCTKKIKDAKPLTAEKKEILKSCLPQKTYTIKDVVENEGKIYRTLMNDCIYKYDKSDLYYKATWKLSEPWRKTELTLGEIIKLTFIEYKPEPKKTIFEEAVKGMEQGKVCRCLFSNRCITINASHFVDCSNGEYTTLSLPEIQSEWVVIDE